MAIQRTSDHVRRALGPARPPVERVYRALGARVAPRMAARGLGRSKDPRAAEIRHAAQAIAPGGLSDEEARWAERIERARAELAGSGMKAQAFGWGVPGPWGRFLMRMAARPGCASCLELGTGIGISAAYIGAGLEIAGSGRLITLERRPDRTEAARRLFASLRLERIEARTGAIEDVLGDALEDSGPLDLAFIDSLKRTSHITWCLDQLRGRLGPRAVVALDDVHWSRQLSANWRAIRRDPRWELSADLWRLGALAERPPAGGQARAYDPPP